MGSAFSSWGCWGPESGGRKALASPFRTWLVQSNRFRVMRLILLFTTDCELLVGKLLISLVPAQPLTHSRR